MYESWQLSGSRNMENSGETFNNNVAVDTGLQIIRHPSYQPSSRSSLRWFDLRVFYIRICKFFIDDSTPECLTVNHIPLSPDTLLEVNGVRCGLYSEGVPSQLRRDRADKKSEEAIFVSTNSIRLTGSVQFEVFDKEELVLFGVLEMSNSNGFTGESRNNAKRWNMDCEAVMAAGSGFLKGKQAMGSESLAPTIEVYVAGSFSGTPIILTKTLHHSFRKKNIQKALLDSIPEYETSETEKNVDGSGLDLQVAEYGGYKSGSEGDYSNMYWGRTDYMEGEDGELSWFNAGVRVGVGISLGICLGIGVGVGLLVRTYQSTTRNFKRLLG